MDILRGHFTSSVAYQNPIYQKYNFILRISWPAYRVPTAAAGSVNPPTLLSLPLVAAAATMRALTWSGEWWTTAVAAGSPARQTPTASATR